MLKNFALSAAISFALLCLNNCGNSESPEKESSLSVKCLEHTITKKSLIETEEIENFAVLTNLNGKTHIHLDKISLDCAATTEFFGINNTVDVDTLKLNGVYKYDIQGTCGGCVSSLDLTIESIGDGIKYLVYEERGGTQIFPVRYEQ